MKTIFIVNPKAGQGKGVKALIEKIENTAERIKADAQIYITKKVGDATDFVKEHCKKHGAARFIACGGDGTFNEVLNGAIECEGAEVGVIPIGTGNDFCRNFKNECDFKNILFQLTGKSVDCDAIKYSTRVNDNIKTGYCANMFNIGFDCNVADMSADMKKKPFVSGALAYFLSILITLIKKNGANLTIELDGEIKHEGKLLLTSVANGKYCGGGIKSNPLGSVHDGFISINIIKDISRTRLINILPSYMKGTFLELKNISKIIHTQKCKKVTIIPNNDNLRLCNDGEIFKAGKTEFEIVHNAFKFVVPSLNVCETSKEEKEFSLTI